MGKQQILLADGSLLYPRATKISFWLGGSVNSFLLFALRPMISPIIRENFSGRSPPEVNITD
jgi:hypothetical protein